MSAVILSFPKGKANPRTVTSSVERQALDRRFRQARLIQEAEKSVPLALWLAFLSVMPEAERAKMQAMLTVRNISGEPDIEQALAIVQFAGASLEHRREVADLMARMSGQAVQP